MFIAPAVWTIFTSPFYFATYTIRISSSFGFPKLRGEYASTREKPAARKIFQLVLSLLAGLFACYIAGTFWYSAFFLGDGGVLAAILYCVVPFLIPDLIKILLAALYIRKLKKSLHIDFCT